MQGLLDLAARYGFAVRTAVLPEDMLGCYVPGLSRIYLDARLTPVEQRCVLGHEIGHAHYRHTCGDDLPGDALRARERQADVFAARLLIEPADYAHAERITSDAHAIADELGVTAELVEVYRAHCLTRHGNVSYALPRLAALPPERHPAGA